MDINNIPQHIAITMDGNGRWAMEKGQPRAYGHSAGVDAVKTITSECARLGVKYLTLYTFSTENWNRPAEEVAALMNLVLTRLEEEIFMKNNVRFQVIGDLQRIPKEVMDRMNITIEKTSVNTGMTMVLAFSYSSRWELTEAVRKIAKQVEQGVLKTTDITEETINKNLATKFMPDPELLIRTGGELRISNYLLWQIAYTELYFCNTYWPDFGVEELHKAISDYQQRQRRFGKTEQQVEEESK